MKRQYISPKVTIYSVAIHRFMQTSLVNQRIKELNLYEKDSGQGIKGLNDEVGDDGNFANSTSWEEW